MLIIPLTQTFLPVCLSICSFYPSYHASHRPFHLSPRCSISAQRRATHPGGAAGLVRFMSREDGRLKGPQGISLCHQHLASMLPANVVGVAAALASQQKKNAQSREISTWMHPPTLQIQAHAMVFTSKNPPYGYLTRACVVSYGHNGSFVSGLHSDSCHRLIPPDLLMGLTTDQAVLEIKNPFVLFRLNSLLDLHSERKPSHRLDSSSCQATKALEYFSHMLCHVFTITMSIVCVNA